MTGIVLAFWLAPAVAVAQDAPGVDEGEDLWAQLENMPPRQSYDLSVGVSFGDITYWRNRVPPWMGFGLRVGGGAHVGEGRAHRLGGALGLGIEGPAPEYFTGAIEPQGTWDFVKNGLLVGASLGPSVLAHSHMTLRGQETFWGLSPTMSARIGYSQPWSRVQRRLFVVADAKIRYVAEAPNWVAGIYVGSGQGW